MNALRLRHGEVIQAGYGKIRGRIQPRISRGAEGDDSETHCELVIDRDASLARFHLPKLPAVTREIEMALKPLGSESLCVSSRSARNRT